MKLKFGDFEIPVFSVEEYKEFIIGVATIPMMKL